MLIENKVSQRIFEFVRELELIPSIDVEKTESLLEDNKKIEDILFKIIINSKFRRTTLDNISKADLINKIYYSIRSKSPIEFAIPFGAYKNYRLPTSPEVDWAEVFNLRFMIRYLLPITRIYEPGVILTYSYNSQVMDKVSNIPINYQKTYEMSFCKLINYFTNLCPKNLQLRAQSINDLYINNEEWGNELGELFNRNKEKWNELYDFSTQKRKIQSAKHNLLLRGVRDLTKLSNDELEQEYLKSAMMCDALDSLEKRRSFNKFSNRIQLIFIRGPKPSIHIGACEGSTLHFWVGVGVIEIRENRIIPKIYSYEQFHSMSKKIQNIEVMNDFVEISSNFNKVLFVTQTST